MQKNCRYLVLLFTFFVLLQSFTIISQAQGNHLVIVYIKDLAGDPIEDVAVMIYQGDVLIAQGATNPLGKSSFYLDASIYDVVAKKKGYKDGYHEIDVSSNMAVNIYLEVGTGSLDSDDSLIYFIFAVIGTFTAVFSTWIGYNAYKFQRTHHPSKYLKKIVEGKK
jgi:hypothetical protein